MRILVLGGTRFIGRAAVRRLAAAGHRVTLFHRGRSAPEALPGLRVLHGDRRELRRHAEALRAEEPDVVLDMIPMTEADAEAAVEVFRGVAQRIVAISSQDVYRAYGILNRLEEGPLQPTPISEDGALRTRRYPYRGEELRPADDPRRWLDDYDKILVEQVVLSAGEPVGTVLRLPMVYGPNDPQHRLFPYLEPMLAHRPALLLDRGLAGWRWTRGHVEDVAAAIELAVCDPRAAGRIYNVGEPEALSMREWIAGIARCVGWEGRVLEAPGERLPAQLRTGMNTAQDLVTDTRRIRRELGFTEPLDREEALRRTVEWERRHPPPHAGNNTARYAEEDRLIRELGLA
jgi:nucleoside-diphosphate-sugar epimerase